MRIGMILVIVLALFIPSGAIGALSDNPQAIMETSKGTIVLELFPDDASETVENFMKYVRSGHYDGTIFHRVIPNFMIQGGGLTPDMKKKTTFLPIKNEADNGLKNGRGTVAMARTRDPHSATDQFFINTKSNSFLDHTMKSTRGWGYAVFAKVVKGMDVVDAISKVKTAKKGMRGDVPVEPVLIIKMTIKE
ncbi:peptidylprolyl isomerase [Thermodesulfobacteriota bacterium]